MRRAAKVDRNQAEIVAVLRTIPGLSVYPTHQIGRGFPDLVVGWRGENYLFEVKVGSSKLTPAETVFFDSWAGRVYVIRNIAEALEALGIKS